MSPAKFIAVKASAATKPHGTRARYIGDRCRCILCRAANSRYQTGRYEARRGGDCRNLVDAGATRDHILALGNVGVGKRAVADAAGVSRSIVSQIRSGEKTKVRASTERLILAVDREAISDRALVPAGPTWQLISLLLNAGYTRRWIARQLGSQAKTPSLQLGKVHVTAIQAVKVERFCKLLDAGRISR